MLIVSSLFTPQQPLPPPLVDEVKEVLHIGNGNNVPLFIPRHSPVIHGVGVVVMQELQ